MWLICIVDDFDGVFFRGDGDGHMMVAIVLLPVSEWHCNMNTIQPSVHRHETDNLIILGYSM